MANSYLGTRYDTMIAVRQINETFTDAEFSELRERKGNRTWHDAILDEFGVALDAESESGEEAEVSGP